MENKLDLEIDNREKAIQFLSELTTKLLQYQGSDIIIAAGSPPALKINQSVHQVGNQRLTPQQTSSLVRAVMSDRHLQQFEQHHEASFSLNFPDFARFRVTAFTQRGSAGMVLRLLHHTVPTLDGLNLPPILRDITMAPRGLVILVGAKGSGKTNALAAMLDYRNTHCQEHIITIEDPIKFFHQHKQGVVLQREVGTDTDSYEIALNNALLQTPTVIMIDEVRDQKTMQYAIKFAETGLCMTTLQASNTEQAFDRIVNFFPKEKQDQVFMNLSVNVKAFVSLRLLPREDKPGLIPAVELMLKTPLIAELISRGRVKELKSAVLRANEQGIITFDQALFNLHEEGRISYETAIRYADAASNLRLRIGQESQRYRSKPLRESSEFEIKDKTRRVKPP